MTKVLSPALVHKFSSAVYDTDLAFRTLQSRLPYSPLSELRQGAITPMYLRLKREGIELAPGSLKLFTANSGLFQVNRLSGFGFVAEGVGGKEGELVLATRGTNFEHNKFDVATDANIGFAIGPRGHTCHRGFVKTFRDYQSQLINLITNSYRRGPVRTVHCVGHSLGGALANLNASALYDAGFNVKLYTIGAPRVGMYSFASDTTQVLPADSIHRVANTGDPVPLVPIYPFIHASKVESEHALVTNDSIAFDNHSLAVGYKSMSRMESWSDLGKPYTSQLDDPRAMEKQMQHLGGGDLMNGGLLRLISTGLTKLFKIMGIMVGSVFQTALGFSLTMVDLIAEVLEKACQRTLAVASEARSILSGMMRFLGRSLPSKQDLNRAFLTWVVNIFCREMNTRAQVAMQRVNKR